MNEAEIIHCVRQLASDMRTLPPSEMMTSPAFKGLASVPGKGSPLTQWFNREADQKRKRIISDILGHIARASYQQKPDYFLQTAAELESLCERLEKE